MTAGQERALAALRIAGLREFTRRAYEAAAGVARTAATAEITELIQHGVLVPRGAGPATRYAFAVPVDGQPRESNRGRPPLWSDERVERELRTLLAGRTTWPTPAEFKDAGKGALYAAASRRGSISRWRRMFGL